MTEEKKNAEFKCISGIEWEDEAGLTQRVLLYKAIDFSKENQYGVEFEYQLATKEVRKHRIALTYEACQALGKMLSDKTPVTENWDETERSED